MYHYYLRPQQKSKNILTEKNKPRASANPRPKNPRDHFLDSSLISSGFENIYICKQIRRITNLFLKVSLTEYHVYETIVQV